MGAVGEAEVQVMAEAILDVDLVVLPVASEASAVAVAPATPAMNSSGCHSQGAADHLRVDLLEAVVATAMAAETLEASPLREPRRKDNSDTRRLQLPVALSRSCSRS